MEITETTVTKKLGRRQRLVLRGLSLGCTEFPQSPGIASVIGSLVTKGLIAADGNRVTLTPHGVRAVFENSATLFAGLPSDVEGVINSLFEVKPARETPEEPAAKRKGLNRNEALLVHFLMESPSPEDELKGVTRILPGLLVKGFVAEVEGRLTVTEAGAAAYREVGAVINEDTAAIFHAADRIERNRKRRERSDAFLQMWRDGVTYEEIGRLHGLSRQAVQQIIAANPGYVDSQMDKVIARVQAEEEKKKDAKLARIQKSLAVNFPEQVDMYWDWEKNGDLDPAKIFAHSTAVEVWWRCPKGHSWKKRPADISLSWIRSKTSGCAACAGKKKKPEPQATLTEAYPELVADYWDFEKNSREGLSPVELTLGSNRRAAFRCPHDGFEWTALIHSTVRQQWSKGNTGCKVCNGTIQRRRGERNAAPRLIEKFPRQVESLWMHDRNSALDITPDVTCGSSKKAWFKCANGGHEWLASIASVNISWGRGASGCPTCAGKRRTGSTEPRIALAGLEGRHTPTLTSSQPR